jgi:hypothetical protein
MAVDQTCVGVRSCLAGCAGGVTEGSKAPFEACENSSEGPSVRLLAGFRKQKRHPSQASTRHDALMFIARRRLCSLRIGSTARRSHSTHKMEKRDYAVCPEEYMLSNSSDMRRLRSRR